MFGALVLAVCTVAATHGSEDPRVMTEGYPLPFSRDLKYATQVWQIRKRLYEPLSLHEVQLLCVATTIRIQYNWAGEQIHFMIGATLRCMQELEIHTAAGTSKNTVEGEMWRRAFWCLVCIDHIIGSYSGCPGSVHDDDYDLEWPIECDDEYWEDLVHPFVQPSGKPSTVMYFTQFIKLCNILGNTRRTIYASKRSKISMDAKDQDWQRRVIMQFDSELNKWQEGLPAHRTLHLILHVTAEISSL